MVNDFGIKHRRDGLLLLDTIRAVRGYLFYLF